MASFPSTFLHPLVLQYLPLSKGTPASLRQLSGGKGHWVRSRPPCCQLTRHCGTSAPSGDRLARLCLQQRSAQVVGLGADSQTLPRLQGIDQRKSKAQLQQKSTISLGSFRHLLLCLPDLSPHPLPAVALVYLGFGQRRNEARLKSQDTPASDFPGLRRGRGRGRCTFSEVEVQL